MKNEKEKNSDASTLTDGEITSDRLPARRSFLRAAGAAMLGMTAVIVGSGRPARASDFPKGSRSDGDATTNKDLKYADSDTNNSKAVDSDRNRLRDVKHSGDSD